jgi:hypothetical protein
MKISYCNKIKDYIFSSVFPKTGSIFDNKITYRLARVEILGVSDFIWLIYSSKDPKIEFICELTDEE